MAYVVMCVPRGLAIMLPFPSSACKTYRNERELKFSEEVTFRRFL